MTRIRTTRTVLLLAMCIVALLVAAFNVSNLIEAYGSGPPYYSRTVNMDKRQSPLPVLSAIDAVALVLLAVCARWSRRTQRHR
jgi:hypothetical protein